MSATATPPPPNLPRQTHQKKTRRQRASAYQSPRAPDAGAKSGASATVRPVARQAPASHPQRSAPRHVPPRLREDVCQAAHLLHHRGRYVLAVEVGEQRRHGLAVAVSAVHRERERALHEVEVVLRQLQLRDARPRLRRVAAREVLPQQRHDLHSGALMHTGDAAITALLGACWVLQ